MSGEIIIMTNDEKLYEDAFRYHHAGRERGAESRDFTWPATTLRLSEFEGAIGLVALERLEEQVYHRFANVCYLHDGLEEIPGLAPLEVDERVTRWNPYRWPFRFIPEEFDGVHRDQFLKAFRGEGVPCGIGATKPLYTFSLFAGGRWGETGCPIACPFYQGEMPDYTKVHCPEAERIHETEAIDMPHTVLLGPRKNMDLILDVCRKLRDNADELRKV